MTSYDGIPSRLALAGGWIDQPFVSRLDPDPPGSMVVVSLEPDARYMERCGLAASTRRAAAELWGARLPAGDPAVLVRELYEAENRGSAAPSGAQDMAGILYPGATRLDFDIGWHGGVFPRDVENRKDRRTAHWLEKVLHLVPVGPRPDGYDPLGVRNLDPAWVRRLGKSGRACFDAILLRDVDGLGESLNETMRCWEALLPQTVVHPLIATDLRALLSRYQKRYPGAMCSGCGGGYLIVASETPPSGALRVRVRAA